MFTVGSVCGRWQREPTFQAFQGELKAQTLLLALVLFVLSEGPELGAEFLHCAGECQNSFVVRVHPERKPVVLSLGGFPALLQCENESSEVKEGFEHRA